MTASAKTASKAVKKIFSPPPKVVDLFFGVEVFLEQMGKMKNLTMEAVGAVIKRRSVIEHLSEPEPLCPVFT